MVMLGNCWLVFWCWLGSVWCSFSVVQKLCWRILFILIMRFFCWNRVVKWLMFVNGCLLLKVWVLSRCGCCEVMGSCFVGFCVIWWCFGCVVNFCFGLMLVVVFLIRIGCSSYLIMVSVWKLVWQVLSFWWWMDGFVMLVGCLVCVDWLGGFLKGVCMRMLVICSVCRWIRIIWWWLVNVC